MHITITNQQRLLKVAGFYTGAIDGIVGPVMQASVQKILNLKQSQLPKNWSSWVFDRKSVAACQILLLEMNFPEVGAVDGFVGPSTQYAFDNWSYRQKHGKPPPSWRPDEEPQDFNEQIQYSSWPAQKHLIQFYGNPGNPNCTAGKVHLPFKMKIAWDLDSEISEFSCHEKVADSMTRVFRKLWSSFSPEEISLFGFDKFGGCYNFRKMRGGTAFSHHSYGIAVDFDPERNQLKWGKNKAFLATPVCLEFWRIWESEGWLSLGRAHNYDWMHVEATK